VVDDAAVELSSQGEPGRRLAVALARFDARLTDVGVALFADDRRLVALLELGSTLPSATMQIAAAATNLVDEVVVGEPREAGDRSIELFVTK